MWQWLASVGVVRVDKLKENDRISSSDRDIKKEVSTEYAETIG